MTRDEDAESLCGLINPDTIDDLRTSPLYYVRDTVTREIRGTNDPLLWATSMTDSAKRVSHDTWEQDGETILVSTVFLGVDYGFGFSMKPILWETMVFGGPYDKYQERYDSESAAVIRHAEIVAALKSGGKPDDAYPDSQTES